MADSDGQGTQQAPSGGAPKQSDAAALFALVKRAFGIITTVSLAALGGLSEIASFNARTLHEAILFALAFGSLLLIVVVIIVVYFYARKSRKLEIKLGTLAAAVVVVMAASTGAGYLAWHSPPGHPTRSAPYRDHHIAS